VLQNLQQDKKRHGRVLSDAPHRENVPPCTDTSGFEDRRSPRKVAKAEISIAADRGVEDKENGNKNMQEKVVTDLHSAVRAGFQSPGQLQRM